MEVEMAKNPLRQKAAFKFADPDDDDETANPEHVDLPKPRWFVEEVRPKKCRSLAHKTGERSCTHSLENDRMRMLIQLDPLSCTSSSVAPHTSHLTSAASLFQHNPPPCLSLSLSTLRRPPPDDPLRSTTSTRTV